MKTDDIKAIIKFAVENEVEAYEFYIGATNKVKDDYLKETFQELAEEELKHKKFLEEFLVSNIDEIKLHQTNDYKIAETIDKPKLTVEMKFADAIGLAIKNEEEAMEMYKNLADICIDEEQKKLFLGLMEMEKMHKAKLEEIYVNVAYAEVW
ncbi:ferritin family protein [Tissierella sp.]|uniref:ferritin-like domain-containing protein n=1 Tax=Tissierella sp. TaxID=41274 RepID=UPI0028AB47A8|nr:ferritin family protein [Tissierella sp.]